MSARDYAIWECKRWNFVVLTPEGIKPANSLSDEDWKSVEYYPDSSPYNAIFVMPGTPLPEHRPALPPAVPPATTSPSSSPSPSASPPGAPEPANHEPPRAPAPASRPPPVPAEDASRASSSLPQIADMPFLNGGLVRWVPVHEADVRRARDLADYERRQLEEEPFWERIRRLCS